MVTATTLENKRKEILLSMKPEELISYFHNLSKEKIKELDYYSFKNGYSSANIEGFNKINSVITDSCTILKKKYPLIETLAITSDFEEIVTKYFDIMEEIKSLLFSRQLLILYFTIEALKENLQELKEKLTLFVIIYFSRKVELKEDVEIMDLLAEVDPLSETQLTEIKRDLTALTSFNNIEESFNLLIETSYSKIVKYIDSFEELSNNIDYEKNLEQVSSEDIVKILLLFNELISEYEKLVEEFEELQEKPFFEGSKILLAEHLSLLFEIPIEDISEFKDNLTEETDIELYNIVEEFIQSNIPEYDFKQLQLKEKG